MKREIQSCSASMAEGTFADGTDAEATTSSVRSARPDAAPADVGDDEQIRESLRAMPDQGLATLQSFVDSFWTPLHG